MKKRLPLILGILAFCCIATVIFGALLPETTPAAVQTVESAPTTDTTAITIDPTHTLQPTQSSRCLPASPQQMEYIRAGIQGVQQSNDVLPGFAVRSNDYERAWFVAAEITGPGIEPKQAIGLWAINGELDEPGIILSVNGFALEFTEYPDGSQTDAQLSVFDDGAQEVLQCATGR